MQSVNIKPTLLHMVGKGEVTTKVVCSRGVHAVSCIVVGGFGWSTGRKRWNLAGPSVKTYLFADVQYTIIQPGLVFKLGSTNDGTGYC